MKRALIKTFSVMPLNVPLITPFRTALGQHDSLENILVSLQLKDGTRGFGEAAVASHITGETVQGTLANLKTVGHSLTGLDASDYLKISAELHERLPNNKCALAAVEMALADALTRQWKIPLWKLFGAEPRTLRTDITIVIDTLDATARAARGYYRRGFRAFKVKIGRDPDLDFERVRTVQKIVGHSPIILDANQGYSADDTLKFLKRLKNARVLPSLIEQPVPKKDWDGLKRVTRLAGVPVCADESVGSLSDAARAVRERAVHAINIKLMKTGMFESVAIARLAKAGGIKLMIGGMMETSLAMTAAAHLAVGLGGFDYVDLDTPFFLKPGRDRNPYLTRRGVYDLRRVPAGIGIRL